MSHYFTIKYFKVLSLVFMMLVSSIMFATTGAKDETKKSTDKDQQQEQVEQGESSSEVQTKVTSKPESENSKEEEGVSLSSVSFNFIFYLIYKIKYADIFKLPTRKKDDASASGWSGLKINQFYQRLIRPNI